MWLLIDKGNVHQNDDTVISVKTGCATNGLVQNVVLPSRISRTGDGFDALRRFSINDPRRVPSHAPVINTSSDKQKVREGQSVGECDDVI